MAAEKEEWKIPQLTAENHDTWFRRNKVKLKGKKVFYVCEKNLVQHCQIATATYKDSALLLVLIRSLPKEFKTTIDTLNAQLNLTVEQKLKFLEEKEVRDQQDANEKLFQHSERRRSMFRLTGVEIIRTRHYRLTPNLVPNSRSNASFVMEPMAYETAQDLLVKTPKQRNSTKDWQSIWSRRSQFRVR
ncbi:hypothetical protein A1F94_003904 [Pyrenophora tritici-repentis]|nr:hypothetical protein A1F94_003904 [Pyrenophora tritici-repentis]